MVLEDAHWLDPTSIELFEEVVARIERLRVLLVVTFRPEFKPPWAGFPHVSQLSLNRLGREQGSTVITAVARGKRLPRGVLEQIVAKTDGVPCSSRNSQKLSWSQGCCETLAIDTSWRGRSNRWQFLRPCAIH